MRDSIDKYTHTNPGCWCGTANSEYLEPSRPPSSSTTLATEEVSHGAEGKSMHKEIVPAPCCYAL